MKPLISIRLARSGEIYGSFCSPSERLIVIDGKQSKKQQLLDTIHELYHMVEWYARRKKGNKKRRINEIYHRRHKKSTSEAEEFVKKVINLR
jgi:hypothetical protein